METLLTIILFLVAAALSAFMRKKPEIEEDHWPDPNQTQPPRQDQPPPQSIGWEEELRGLLEGRTSSSERAPSQPPLVATPTPPPLPQPEVKKWKTLHDWAKPSKKPEEKRPRRSPSADHYRTTQNIQARVTQQMKEAARRIDQHRRPRRRSQRTPEIRQALRLFRNARSARMAVIVAEILGPSKAMQGERGNF